jgi:pimeloyl-ACP methyl ester carboxylesterase
MFRQLIGILLILFTMSGCDIKLPWDAKPPVKADAEEAQAASEGEGGGATDDPAAADVALLPPAMKNLPYEEVELPMRDRLVIYGRLYVPGMRPEGDEAVASADSGDEEGAPKYPLVILLHGLNRNQLAWGELPAVLVKANYAVLALDLRGHGKSTRTASGRRVTWRFLDKAQWRDLPEDIVSVIRTFRTGEDYPRVDGKNVALIGEKLGANVAVLAARDSRETVKALTLISPGLDYKGLTPSQAILDFHAPVLLLTSQDDEYANKSTRGLYNWILDSKTLLEYGRIGDGADMLTGRPAIQHAIRDWLLKSLPPPVTSLPPEEKTNLSTSG